MTVRGVVLVAATAAAVAAWAAWAPVTEAAFSGTTQRPGSSAAASTAFACEAYDAEVRATPGVASLWRLGDSGTTAADSVGARAGTYLGGPTQQVAPHSTSETDRAVAFTADGQYVEVPDAYDFTGTAAFTIAAWVRPRTGALPDSQRIVSKDGSPAGVRAGWGLTYLPSGAVSFSRWQSDTIASSTTSPVLSTGRWYHLAGTFDGATQRLYLDGALVASTADAASLPDTTLPLRLGAAAEGASPPSFPGDLNDVAVYTAALSAARIEQHATADCTYASLTRRTPALASYWPLDDLTAEAADVVGGQTAAQDGSTAAGVNGALPSNSRYARGFTATGSLGAGDVYDFPARAPFTIEAWLRPEPDAFTRYGRAISKENQESGMRAGWMLLVLPDGTLSYEQWSSGTFLGGVGSPSPLVAGRWYHVAITYDGTTLRLYLDGTEVETQAPSGDLPDTTAAFRIGGTDYDTGHSRWVGGLDEVAIYTSVLSPQQILAHYTAR